MRGYRGGGGMEWDQGTWGGQGEGSGDGKAGQYLPRGPGHGRLEAEPARTPVLLGSCQAASDKSGGPPEPQLSLHQVDNIWGNINCVNQHFGPLSMNSECPLSGGPGWVRFLPHTGILCP